MMEKLTPEQKVAIKEFWFKAKPKGWKYTGQVRATVENTLIITLLDPKGNKHWLQVTADGKVCFRPTTLAWRDGGSVF